MTTRKSWIFLLLLIISISTKAQTSLPAFKILSDTGFSQKLDKNYWQKLEDAEGKWTFDDVKRLPLSNKFHYCSTPSVSKDSVSTNWIRFNIQNTLARPVKISIGSASELSDFYVLRNKGTVSHFATGSKYPWSKKRGLKRINAIPVFLDINEVVSVYIRKYNREPFSIKQEYEVPIYLTDKITEKELLNYQDNYLKTSNIYLSFISGLLFLASIFNLLTYLSVRNKVNLYFSLFLLSLFIEYQPLFKVVLASEYNFVNEYLQILVSLWSVFFMLFIRHYFKVFNYFPRWDKFLLIFPIFIYVVGFVAFISGRNIPVVNTIINLFFLVYMLSIVITIFISARVKGEQNRIFYIATAPLIILLLTALIAGFFTDKLNTEEWSNAMNFTAGGCVLWAVVIFSKYLFEDYGKQQQKILQVQIEKEKEQVQFIALQKVALEEKVAERTQELKQSLEELKSTQAQLIQSEKMASLGELTAGIAHEIQNPLNFVNNFSEVSLELIGEVKSEKLKAKGERDSELENELLDDISQNLQKIAHHGKRADSIVKGMLQHSRSNSGKKEFTDINALADEYLRLSYHGLRAKDKSFNATINTDFDETIGTIEVVQQDIGRVLLNLFNNAFYAVQEKRKAKSEKLNEEYKPTVEVSTSINDGFVVITVRDNGNGIPDAIKEKIMQPFFTTKPTGEGTGLGLSLSYDIIKAHGGKIKVNTREGEYTEFSIIMPSKPILVA